MTHVGRKHGPGADDLIASSKRYLLDMHGEEGLAKREAEISCLPRVIWKGRELCTLRCQGTSGKGPHAVNVPIAVVWALISLHKFFCVYHAGDCWSRTEEEWNAMPSVLVERLVELYGLRRRFPLIGAYQAEQARLLTHLSPAESKQYYAAIDALKPPGRTPLQPAAADAALPDTPIEWP